MRLRPRPRRLVLAGALAALGTLASAQPVPKPVTAPHYGDALFHFFQDRHFTAITTLMASQQFQRIAPHDDEAEVLRGGMLLSYGLHDEAGRIFETLIERQAAPSVRDRAWFFLAKIRYQRGYVAQAEEAVARIGEALPAELRDERRLLEAQLKMARGDYAGAAVLLRAIDPKSAAAPYARFNLGVALLRGGDAAQGEALLEALGKEPMPDEALRVLRDRANLALGFAALQDRRAEQARTTLERVRLNGPQSSKALLGFGWAAAELKQYDRALVPWTELLGRDASDAAVLEARIALPHAYAELGATGQALQRYQQAIEFYDGENARLDESIAAIRAGKLLGDLAEKNPGGEMGWFWSIEQLPTLPHPAHLAMLLAEHPFQEAFKNWRDLRFLADNLRDWESRLGIFGDMLDNRRKAFAERLPAITDSQKQLDDGVLRQRREALAAELQRAEKAADGQAFADERQRALMARVAGAREALAALGDAPEAAEARERLRRGAGALSWELAQQQPLRQWEATKALRGTDAALAEAAERQARLGAAMREEPLRFDAFARRIAALQPRLAALAPRVAAALGDQQAQLGSLAIAALQQQKERLAAYTTQARFAVAQLQDRAATASRDGGKDEPRAQ